MTRSEGGWFAPALVLAVFVTVARLVLLAFNRTDLFVDESQYWFWGQSFAFGYYSKPPLIAWVIGAVTSLAGSDSTFWVRAPGPVFHGATALILGALAARLGGRRAALWVTASYLTLPMVALGSLLISTDTIMAPFFAAALYFHLRLTETRAGIFALLAGVMAGLAFLAKYAAVYFVLGAVLGSILIPAMRIPLRQWLLMLGAFVAAISPNILWNLNNGLATAEHTMDNVGWVREAQPLSNLNPGGMAEFFLSQFAVFGPVLFAALLWAVFRGAENRARRLLVFVVPPVVLVSIQALLNQAYANWAASAYFAGTVVAVAVLLPRPRWLSASLAIGTTLSLALPIVTLMPWLDLGGQPVLQRYLGRTDLSLQILALAKERGLPVVTDRRDVIADLFYTGRDTGVALYAAPPHGRPTSHYEQSYALPNSVQGDVLYVAATPPSCGNAPTVQALDTSGGAYAKLSLSAYVVDAGCLHADE
ncbi:MAG: glycosyl transferase [Cereibacter sphaeroides]|uniref:Glycosyl transferase n=1 Tax=Cereibacter sphaeroides TaxID=1063 RepID=A0A2W5RVS0_CERSP|nr:MAG: glycosyl transferase [Cereibacter sphaeroides]